MRIFIAYTLPDSFKQELALASAALREKHPHFRWTPERNIHITLAFLGDIEKTAIPLLDEVLKGKIPHTPQISIRTHNLFTLPRQNHANVLALGLSRGEEEIRMMAGYIEGHLEHFATEGRYPFRPAEHRTFTAHLTLARKGRDPMRLTREELKPILIDSFIKKAVIFQSELSRTGAIYTPLAEFELWESNS